MWADKEGRGVGELITLVDKGGGWVWTPNCGLTYFLNSPLTLTTYHSPLTTLKSNMNYVQIFYRKNINYLIFFYIGKYVKKRNIVFPSFLGACKVIR